MAPTFDAFPARSRLGLPAALAPGAGYPLAVLIQARRAAMEAASKRVEDAQRRLRRVRGKTRYLPCAMPGRLATAWCAFDHAMLDFHAHERRYRAALALTGSLTAY